MSNWCWNKITVTGEKENIKEFDRKFKGHPVYWYKDDIKYRKINETELFLKLQERNSKPKSYCFNSLLPPPKDVMKKGFNDAGFEWCCNNWGTKGDIYGEVTVEEQDNSISYEFETANSPCIDFVVNVSKLFPALKFKVEYDSWDSGFRGHIEYRKGLIGDRFHEKYYPYSDTEEDLEEKDETNNEEHSIEFFIEDSEGIKVDTSNIEEFLEMFFKKE